MNSLGLVRHGEVELPGSGEGAVVRQNGREADERKDEAA
jgi:hypothetical protein